MMPVPHYDVAHLADRLARDPRTAQLGIRARIHGSRLFLEGEVASEEQKRLVGEVAQEQLPDLLLHNDLRVERPRRPDHGEDLA
jgi:hypothetical protein